MDFFMVLDPLVPSSTENLNLLSIGFSEEFDSPCLYSNLTPALFTHIVADYLANVLPISLCSNAPPHFCVTVIRSLCLHSSYDIASCVYIIIYAGIPTNSNKTASHAWRVRSTLLILGSLDVSHWSNT